MLNITLLLSLTASVSSAVIVSPKLESVDLSGRLDVLEDSSKQLTIEQVRAEPWTGRFRSAGGKIPNHGFTTSDFWYRIQLRSPAQERVYLKMPYVVIDRLEVFVEAPSAPGKSGFKRYLMGDTVPGGGRVVDQTDYVIPVELQPNRPTWVYLRAQTEGSLQLPLTLWRADALFGAVAGRQMFYFPIFGLLTMLLIYNLVLFAMFREASYGYLSLCVIGAAIYLAYFTGLAQAYVLANCTWLANRGYPLAMMTVHLPMWLFTRRFLELRRQLPRVDKAFSVLAALGALSLPIAIFASYRTALFWAIAVIIVGVVASPAVGVYTLLRGNRSARYYVLGWSLFFIGIVVFAVEKTGLLPTSIVTNNIHVVGYVATLMVLPLGLADRINVLRQEKAVAQAEALEAQARALEVQHEMSVHLEQEVKRKTADLAERNEQLRSEIEQRERTELERVELQRSLFQSQKMDAIGRLAGGVAHDMNNILAVISLTTENVQHDLPADDVAHAALDDVLTAAKRGGELAKNLLGFARRGRYQTKRLSLNEAIDEIYRLLRRTIHQGVTIVLELAPDLAEVKADPNNISQIVVNLAVNAAHAMSNKGVLTFHTRNAVIGLAAESEADGLEAGRYVCLEVSDTGVGMDEATRGQVFEPFFTTKGPGEGTGLGLSMVYGAVEAHGGRVMVDSTPGQGATFRILLPALEPDTQLPRPEKPRRRSPSAETPHGAVLVVDDEQMLRRSTRMLLERMGYKVFDAEHGREALEIYERERGQIVAVLLDLVMPVMDGPETFNRLRELNRELPVVLSSGFSEEGHAAELLMAGASGFLQKPYELVQLKRALERALGLDNADD